MATVNLEAKPRVDLGKQGSKKVRRAGLIPATLYGHGMKPLSLQMGSREFHQTLQTKAGENVVLSLQVEGVKLKESTCLIKEIQHNPVTDEIAHVDLTVISLTEKITVKVPLVVTHVEEAAGVKEGGSLDVVHHEVEVECLPTEIPEKIEFNVKDMAIGDSVHAKDLQMPKGVTCTLDADEVVISLHPPMKEEAAPGEEAGTAEPEVIEKGKKIEGEEGAPAPAAAPAAKKPEKEK